MNWDARTMKEEFDRKPGLNPASWKYGVGWIGGTPLQQHSRQTFMVNGKYGWHIDGPGSAPVAGAARRCRALAARDVAEPARLPQGRAAAGRQPGGGVALGARRDGPRRPDDDAREGHRRLDPDGQVPGRRDDQQGEHAAADSHLGAAPRARRHELRARVHQRQLRRHRQRHQVPDRLASPRGLGRQLQRAEHHRRPQRASAARSRTSRPTPATIRCTVPDVVRQADVSGPRRRADARRRRVPARRLDAQQRRRRVQGLRRRRRSAARRGAEPGGDRGDREADAGQADPLPRQHPPAFRSHRRAAHLPAHRRDHRHALEELRLLQSRRAERRAADAAAGHGVALAADRALRGLQHRDGARELRDHRRHAHHADLLRAPAAARRGHADGVSAEGEAASIEADLFDTHVPPPAAPTAANTQPLQRGADAEARRREDRADPRPAGAVDRLREGDGGAVVRREPVTRRFTPRAFSRIGA